MTVGWKREGGREEWGTGGMGDGMRDEGFFFLNTRGIWLVGFSDGVLLASFSKLLSRKPVIGLA